MRVIASSSTGHEKKTRHRVLGEANCQAAISNASVELSADGQAENRNLRRPSLFPPRSRSDAAQSGQRDGGLVLDSAACGGLLLGCKPACEKPLGKKQPGEDDQPIGESVEDAKNGEGLQHREGGAERRLEDTEERDQAQDVDDVGKQGEKEEEDEEEEEVQESRGQQYQGEAEVQEPECQDPEKQEEEKEEDEAQKSGGQQDQEEAGNVEDGSRDIADDEDQQHETGETGVEGQECQDGGEQLEPGASPL